MSIFKKIILMAFLTALVIGIVSCEKEGPMEKAGKQADQAIEKTEKAVEDAAEAVKEKTQ
jgi:hypothetical protein